MKSRLIFLLFAAHAGAALAQYKCTAANGAITFQQTPCAVGQAEQKLVIVPNGHPPAASGVQAPAAGGKVETNVDKRMLADYEKERHGDELEQALKKAQDDKAGRAAMRLQDIAAARRQFGGASANAQALRDALVSIDKRYNALAELDDSRIRAAQAALDNWDNTQAPQPGK